MENKNAAPGQEAAPSTASVGERQISTGHLHSTQVQWWVVHEWVTPFLEQVGLWPPVGTPAWDALADDDPRKLAAVLDAGQHWALRLDAIQDALADASRAISDAEDWKLVAERFRRYAELVAAQPWLKRVVA